MALADLLPSSGSIPIQQTAFSYDVLGRYVCNTWDEVAQNGGDPFDVVVIGAGMFGGYIADKLYRFGEDIGLRILVIDAGAFLISTHVQNLPKIGLFAPDVSKLSPVTGNDQDPGTQNIVWGFPWHGNQKYAGLAYCLGGQSIYWGGWGPRMTDADLTNWPPDAVAYLQANYERCEREVGIKPTTNHVSGPFYGSVLQRVKDIVPADYTVAEAPLAIQAKTDESGLFAFDKYSSAYLLIDAIRDDVASRGKGDVNDARRLMFLPRTHVNALQTDGQRATGLELNVLGIPQMLGPPVLSRNCTMVLANSTVEATRLAMESFRTPRMGANLMAHLRSNITIRIRRELFSGLSQSPTDLETAALIVRGTTSNNRSFHVQLTAAAITGTDPEKNMFAAIPDIDQLDRMRANQDPAWVVLTLRAIGEMEGDKSAKPGDIKKSWIDLTRDDPNQIDKSALGRRRAWVNLEPTDEDQMAWKEMEQRTIDLGLMLGGGDKTKVQYLVGGSWVPAYAPTVPRAPLHTGEGRDAIGATYHECGTLWMGSVIDSVTDSSGKFHHIDNAYVAGPALFPTSGSANPSLTGITLARKTAQAIVQGFTVKPGNDFEQLFTGSRAGWQMAGGGDVLILFNSILEMRPGWALGLFWYTRRVFRNFILKVDWLSFHPESDNSGIFIRFPALNASDPTNDWKAAVDNGYEIQIDDGGFNPDTNQKNDAAHQTGAVYGLCPSSRLASKPAGEWNTFEIEATKRRIRVTLNGTMVTDCPTDGSRPASGHIGLQTHTGNVQFRKLMVKTLPD
jgi:hypothetical protein